MCRYLQAEGLDLGILNSNGHSALHKAAVKGNHQVCEWLLDHGGLGELQMKPDADGNTPAIMVPQLSFHARLTSSCQTLPVADFQNFWK
eukprot:symbB.v1.2.004911.t1/scaffold263.1/size248082/12